MMGVRYCVLLIALLAVCPHISFAAVSYDLVTELSNSATIKHGDTHTIKYTFANTNLACAIACTASMKSSYYETPPIAFTITTSTPVTEQFSLHAPSKSEVDYDPDGVIQYALDISCSTIESIIPLCFDSVESVSPSTEDSSSFTLHYGLSPEEQQAKSDYESLVTNKQSNIQEFHNRANELDSYYSNLKGNILIPSSLQNEVDQLAKLGDDALTDFEKSQEKYAVLDVLSALSELAKYDSTNFEDLVEDVEDVNQKLEELKTFHDSIVQELKNLQTTFTENSEEFQRAGLKKQYLELVQEYEAIRSDLETLQFSLYDTLQARVVQLKQKYEALAKEQEANEKDLYTQLNEILLQETTKIDAPKQLASNQALSVTITSFCQEFQTTIPQEFREFNDANQKKIAEQNTANKKRNAFLDSISVQWSQLTQTTIAIQDTASDKMFNKKIASGCNISAVLKQEFTQAELDATNNACTQFKDQLEKDIAKNQRFTARFLNFFKYMFSEKSVMDQTSLPDLEGYYQPTDSVFTPVTFDNKTKAAIVEHCEFNPHTISLATPRDVNQIGFDSSNTVIEFSNIQGDCEQVDCYNNRDTYPVLFVHGHMFVSSKDPMVESRYTFDKMISYIASHTESTYDAGTIVDKGNEFLDAGLKTNAGVALFRTTYYGHAYIDPSGNFQFEKRNYESISEYANKLSSIIDATIETTGRKQIKIVSHSMGGLVVREYLRMYGSSKVDTFIMVGTPNDGITGDIQELCDNFGADTECLEMSQNSSFLSQLKQEDNFPSKVYTITGLYKNADSAGDGVVRKESVQISGVTDHLFRSTKSNNWGLFTYIGDIIGTTTLVHADLVDPDEMSEVSDKIIVLLEVD